MKTKKTKAVQKVVLAVEESDPTTLTLRSLSTGEAAIDEYDNFIIRTDEGYLILDGGLHFQEDCAQALAPNRIKQFIGRLKFSAAE